MDGAGVDLTTGETATGLAVSERLPERSV